MATAPVGQRRVPLEELARLPSFMQPCLSWQRDRRAPEAPDRPGQLNLWRMRSDGSEYQPLTRYSFPAFGGSWSPDGQWISLVTNEDPTNLKNRDGYLVRPDGSEARRVLSVRPG